MDEDDLFQYHDRDSDDEEEEIDTEDEEYIPQRERFPPLPLNPRTRPPVSMIARTP